MRCVICGCSWFIVMAELEEMVPTLTDAMQMVHADGVVFVGGDEDDIEVLKVVEGLGPDSPRGGRCHSVGGPPVPPAVNPGVRARPPSKCFDMEHSCLWACRSPPPPLPLNSSCCVMARCPDLSAIANMESVE